MSLDGRIGLENGCSKWITNQSASNKVHQIRSKCDAVIVGGGTVRADDPLLTSRGHSDPEPKRVVLSRSLDLPQQAQLWNTAVAKTLVAHGLEPGHEQLAHLPEGPELLALPASEPLELLRALAQQDCNRVLWECGPGLAAAALQQGCVQELAVVVAPKLLGGLPARTPLDDLGLTRMNQALVLEPRQFQQSGDDWIIRLIL